MNYQSFILPLMIGFYVGVAFGAFVGFAWGGFLAAKRVQRMLDRAGIPR